MNRRSLLLVPLFVFSACVQAEEPVGLDSLVNPVSTANTSIPPIRAQMLSDAGRTVGFRGGMLARAKKIADSLDVRAKSLDVMFQFAPLLSKQGMLPPVISEARDLASFSSDQVRMANKVYNIESEERFVSVPPTWRDFLFVGLSSKGTVELPVFEVRPQDGKEQTIWKDAVQKGWAEGEGQADAILEANFNRLVRDYTGMMLYATLMQQGIIGKTKVVEYRKTVSGDSKRLVIGEIMKRVGKKSAFEVDPNKWQPVIVKGRKQE